MSAFCVSGFLSGRVLKSVADSNSSSMSVILSCIIGCVIRHSRLQIDNKENKHPKSPKAWSVQSGSLVVNPLNMNICYFEHHSWVPKFPPLIDLYFVTLII